ncbi:MAG: low-specificity L-threonine aldolase [Candidatus Marinimicrobia bacterium]|nr:low-specificity L-threonine aldolase [Candidatus Neomarinimicrobiota bacterium]
MEQIDLRSDTVTQPTKAMLEAMIKAPVGDDVLGDDPSVIRLQKKVAERFGKEAGLFVPSGTMSNQVAIKTHTQPGQEVLCDIGAHIYNFEGGAPAVLSGVQIRPLFSTNGILDPEKIKENLRFDDNVHHAPTALIEVENTHNRGGGTIIPLENIQKIRTIADQYRLSMHLDGARIWNAHVATEIPLNEYARYFESVSVCFSKGLGAPVGSMLLGSISFIEKAKRWRKVFGGGMRQAGYLAAAAEYAFEHHIERLKEDHEHAKYFASELNKLSGLSIHMESVQTNIVMIDMDHLSASDLQKRLLAEGLVINPVSPTRLRAVFHLHINDEKTERAISIFQKVLSSIN